MLGAHGYAGGMPKLLEDNGVHRDTYKKRPLKQFNVWHVGGPNRYKQYRPQHFVVPVINNAVKGGASRLVCLVTEGVQSGKNVKTDSGLTGDAADLKKYLPSMLASNDKMGVYYRLLNPVVEVRDQTSESPCKVYLDFDLTEFENWQRAWDIVHSCVVVVRSRLQHEAKIAGIDVDARYVVAYNTRLSANGKMKYSFHVVFPEHGFQSPFQLKSWLAEFVGCFDFPYDDKVYSRHQLMRMPWCGKKGDIRARLLPQEFTKDDQGEWSMKCISHEFDPRLFDAFNINFYDYERNNVHVHQHDRESKTKGVAQVGKLHVPQSSEVPSPKDQFSVDMMNFMSPLLPHIRSKIQEHRRSIAKIVGSGGGVPTHNSSSPTVLQHCGGNNSRVGIYHYQVDGDLFCEYDEPNYLHNTGAGKITIQLNLLKGTYNQLCLICQPRGNNIRYYSLFEMDRISVRLFSPTVSATFLDISKDGLPSMFIKYFQDDLIFNPAICPNVIVYDEDTKLWVYSDRTKGNILNKKKNIMKDRYINYLTARYLTTVDQRRREASKKEKPRILKEGKEISKVPAFVDQKNFIDLITANMHESEVKVPSLDPYPNLVPLKDGQCYDVFTGRQLPMQKYHYFTSRVNGVMKPMDADDEDIQFIQDWFAEISSQRPAHATYLQELSGLLHTFLKLDRKAYINLAPAGSNGKSIFRKMLKLSMTDSTGIGQNRYTNLNNKFFSLQANSGTAASAPRPDWIKMMHKTCYLVEELPAVKLDVDIIKLIASMDEYEARLLYHNFIVDILIRGRLLINSNYPPQAGDTKPVWNRLVLIPWDTTYVENKKDVDVSKNKLLMNQQFINIIQTKIDAFITVSLTALHKAIRAHVVNGELKLSELKRPKSVTEFTEFHRAKHMSVEIFVNRYMRSKENGDFLTPCTRAYSAYRTFLKEQGNADVDYITFCDKLKVHNYETTIKEEQEFFSNLVLTDEGHQLTNSAAPKGSIENAFFVQESKRRRQSGVAHVRSQECILNPDNCSGIHVI
jgi:phage/plasmid-associated DNA primase